MGVTERCCHKWNDLLYKLRVFIIVFWVLILPVSWYFGREFTNWTLSDFPAPEGTEAYDAQQVYTSQFPQLTWPKAVLFVEALGNNTIYDNFVESLSFQYQTMVTTECSLCVEYMIELQGYYFYYNTSLKDVSGKFVGGGGNTTIINLVYNRMTLQQKYTFVDTLRGFASRLNTQPDRYFIGITGEDATFVDVTRGMKEGMASMEVIVFPLAMLVIAVFLRSLRLMISPIISVLLAYNTSFMVMYPIARYLWQVASYAPSIMMSLCIAMSIDYNLFMLSRFVEEVDKKNVPIKECVRRMNTFAGEIVLVSGSTLAITFMGLAMFPLEFLSSIGWASAFALLITMTINLTLLPALLLVFDKFFSNFDGAEVRLLRKLIPARWLETPQTVSLEDLSKRERNILEQEGFSTGEVNVDPRVADQVKSFWFKAAQCSTHRLLAVAIILLSILFAMPIAYFTLTMNTTIDATQLYPEESDALTVFAQMQLTFAPGLLQPYFLLVVPWDSSRQVLTSDFWDVLNNLTLTHQQQVTGVASTGYTSPFYINGQSTPLSTAQLCMTPGNPVYNSDAGYAYRYAFETYTNTEVAENGVATAAVVQMSVEFPPMGDGAAPFIESTRDMLYHFGKLGFPYTYYLIGGATQQYDAVETVQGLFPTQVGVTVGAVVLVTSFLFRSIFYPFRLVLTVMLPILWVYGLAVLVFEVGIVNFFGGQLDRISELYWLSPIMSFSILVGLGLDYDIFLYSRVMEYRMLGYTTTGALTKGVYKTGAIIAAAGVIMAISFSGLMMSTAPILIEFGFMLTFAVLLDTFFVCLILVPAICAMVAEAQWWPATMPRPYRKSLEPDEDSHFGSHGGGGGGHGSHYGTYVPLYNPTDDDGSIDLDNFRR